MLTAQFPFLIWLRRQLFIGLGFVQASIVQMLPDWVITQAQVIAIDNATDFNIYPRSEPGDIRAITVLNRWVNRKESK